MSDFFSNDYEIPTTSNYLRFDEPGEYRFRILGTFADGKAIMGTEYWVTKGDKRVPKRLKMGEPVPTEELEINKFGNLDTPKHFWALPVWNYEAKRVQILELTQISIQKDIMSLAKNKKWGDPRQYDLVITRLEGKPVKYNTIPDPKEALDPAIKHTYENTFLDLKAMFDNEDPFKRNDDLLAEDPKKEPETNEEPPVNTKKKLTENVNPDDIPL